MVTGSHTYAAFGSFTVTVVITALPSNATATADTSANVSAAVPTHFVVSADASGTAGSPVAFTVTAEDGSGNTTDGYTGTVEFSSGTDASAQLPANSTLTNGVGSFNVTFETAGNENPSPATDTVSASITGTSGTVAVAAGAATHFPCSRADLGYVV